MTHYRLGIAFYRWSVETIIFITIYTERDLSSLKHVYDRCIEIIQAKLLYTQNHEWCKQYWMRKWTQSSSSHTIRAELTISKLSCFLHNEITWLKPPLTKPFLFTMFCPCATVPFHQVLPCFINFPTQPKPFILSFWKYWTFSYLSEASAPSYEK